RNDPGRHLAPIPGKGINSSLSICLGRGPPMKRLLLAAAVVATFLTVPATSASASTCGLATWCETDYYSSPSHTTLVGYKYIACGGAVITSGKVTPYYTYHTGSCTA
ncbi:MAG TPA: DUF6289 family protein, partial [Micromonosporaceae bacterium]